VFLKKDNGKAFSAFPFLLEKNQWGYFFFAVFFFAAGFFAVFFFSTFFFATGFFASFFFAAGFFFAVAMVSSIDV